MKKALLVSVVVFISIITMAVVYELPELVFAHNGRIISVSGEHVVEGSSICVVNLQIPTIRGLSNVAFESFVNSEIKSAIESYRNEIEEMADEAYEASKGQEWPFRTFSVYVTYDAYLSDGILSIDMIFSEYTGGAHPGAARRTYNIDVNGNHMVSFKSLFPDEAFESRLNSLLAEEIGKREDLWLDSFKGVEPDQGFYLKAGRLNVYFQPYDIGPWSSGMPEFVFNMDELR
jgi:hypothetical protein